MNNIVVLFVLNTKTIIKLHQTRYRLEQYSCTSVFRIIQFMFTDNGFLMLMGSRCLKFYTCSFMEEKSIPYVFYLALSNTVMKTRDIVPLMDKVGL